MPEDSQETLQPDAQPVETTTTDSSTAEQTPQNPEPQAPETESGNSVPEINRIREAQRKAEKEAQQLRRELDEVARAQEPLKPQAEANPELDQVKAALKDLGFISQDDMARTLKEREDDQRIASELTSLEGKYNGSDGRPKFDRSEVVSYGLEKGILNPEAAYRDMHMDTLINWHVEQAIKNSRGVKTETSDGSGSSEVGTTSSDLQEAAKRGDKSALRSLFKRYAPKE